MLHYCTVFTLNTLVQILNSLKRLERWMGFHTCSWRGVALRCRPGGSYPCHSRILCLDSWIPPDTWSLAARYKKPSMLLCVLPTSEITHPSRSHGLRVASVASGAILRGPPLERLETYRMDSAHMCLRPSNFRCFSSGHQVDWGCICIECTSELGNIVIGEDRNKRYSKAFFET